MSTAPCPMCGGKKANLIAGMFYCGCGAYWMYRPAEGTSPVATIKEMSQKVDPMKGWPRWKRLLFKVWKWVDKGDLRGSPPSGSA